LRNRGCSGSSNSRQADLGQIDDFDLEAGVRTSLRVEPGGHRGPLAALARAHDDDLQ